MKFENKGKWIKQIAESSQKNEDSDEDILRKLAEEFTENYEVSDGTKYSVKAIYDNKDTVKINMSRVSKNFPMKKEFLLKLDGNKVDLLLNNRKLDSIYKTMNTAALAGNFKRAMRDTYWGPSYELDFSSKDKNTMSKLDIKPMTQNISGKYVILYYLPNKGYGINVASNGKVQWWHLDNKEYSSLEEASNIAKDAYPDRQQYYVGKVESHFYAESAQKNEDDVIRRGKTIDGNPWTETKIKEVTVNILGVNLKYNIVKFHVEMPEDKRSFTDKDRIEYKLVNENDLEKLEKTIQNAIRSKMGNKVTYGSGRYISIDTSGYIN